MSTVQLERAKAKRSQSFLDGTRSRRTGNVDGATIAKRIQVLEANHDAARKESTPTVVIPQLEADGSLSYKPMEEVSIAMREPAIERMIMDKHNALLYELRHGPREWVYNPTDEFFIGIIEGIDYGVASRERKQLPVKLAAHFRTKMSYIKRNADYERAMGVSADLDKPIGVMEFNKFKDQVQHGDGTEDVMIDREPRKLMF